MGVLYGDLNAHKSVSASGGRSNVISNSSDIARIGRVQVLHIAFLSMVL